MDHYKVIKKKVPLEKRQCRACERSFLGVSYAVYCSPTCRKTAQNVKYWENHKEELTVKRRESYRRQKAKAAKG
jgi:hypothetical protein